MNKKFIDLIKNVEIQIDAGMREDLKEFLEDDRFLFSHINIKEKKYIIKIGVVEYSCPEIRSIFCEFLMFIGYNYMNIYNINYTDRECIIEYLTLMDEKFGAEFKIIFLPSDEN